MSGVSAALMAARAGAIVQLLDPLEEPGGSIGERFQVPMDFDSSTNNPFFRESGLYEEILGFLRTENTEGTFTGQSRALLSLLKREKNISLMLGHNCGEISLNSSGDRIDSCTSVNYFKGLKYLHRAKFFIDCSDFGDFSGLSNAPGERRKSVNLNSGSSGNQFFKSSAIAEIASAEHEIPFQCPDWIVTRWENNLLSARISWIKSLEKKICGFHHLEWVGQNSNIPESDELCWAAWDYIKNRSPLKDLAKNLFIKRIIPQKNTEVFRGTGDYTLTEDDLTKSVTFNDSVAICRSPFAKATSSVFSLSEKILLSQSFEIPLRSLYSRKIKNLLWAGAHISCDALVSDTLTHQPSLAQMGSAVGFCAAKCVTDKRLPRTLSKTGHIEILRRELERNNHRTSKTLFNDDDNLMGVCRASASTTWQDKNLLELPRRMGKETKACLIQFPLTSDELDTIRLLLHCTTQLKIDGRLLEGAIQNQHIPGACLQTDTVEITDPSERWITFTFKSKIKHKGWHYLELRSDQAFTIIEASNAPVGHLVQYPRKVCDLPGENPYSEYCVEPFHSAHPHHCAVTEIIPSQKPFEATELITDNKLPLNLPGLWISQPSNFSYPEFVEFHWSKPISVSRIDLFFDPCLGYSTPPLPELTEIKHATSLIRDFRIYLTSEEGKSEMVQEIRNNSSSHRVLNIDSCRIKSMEIEILATHGLNRAQIFRVAAYE